MRELSVWQINKYLKDIIEYDKKLSNVYVQGEITNLSAMNKSGHLYFSLKDDKSQIKCAMWSSFAARLKFKPENGQKVLVSASVSVYEPRGEYQLKVLSMLPAGLGAEGLALEQLKQKLLDEGLFDEKYKKPLPKYPKKIGIITSATGAAIRDIVSNIELRWKLAELVICPCTVQGENAAKEIANSIKTLENHGGIDVIIFGRGGGSKEDLIAFNDENLARTIFACKIPTISAVGHEIDTSISDLVADVSVMTPTKAAEFAVPNQTTEMENVLSLWDSLNYFQNKKISDCKNVLENILDINHYTQNAMQLRSNQLEILTNKLKYTGEKTLQYKILEFTKASDKLDALSPLKVLTRGFTLLESENIAISSTKQIKKDDIITAKLKDGQAKLKVIDVRGD